MSSPIRAFPLALVLAFVAGACDSGHPEPTFSTLPGEIVVGHHRAFVEVNGVIKSGPGLVTRAIGNVSDETPVVRAGVPFEVTVGTFGGGTPLDPCGGPAPSVITSEPGRLTIVVMDDVPVEYPDGYGCALAMVPMLRTDTVVLPEPGPAEIVVVGREWQIWMASEPAGFTQPTVEMRFAVEVVD